MLSVAVIAPWHERCADKDVKKAPPRAVTHSPHQGRHRGALEPKLRGGRDSDQLPCGGRCKALSPEPCTRQQLSLRCQDLQGLHSL